MEECVKKGKVKSIGNIKEICHVLFLSFFFFAF